MSREFGPLVEYKCFQDCKQTGCPGHKMREIYNATADIVNFEIDGKIEYLFDPYVFEAMLRARELLKAGHNG